MGRSNVFYWHCRIIFSNYKLEMPFCHKHRDVNWMQSIVFMYWIIPFCCFVFSSSGESILSRRWIGWWGRVLWVCNMYPRSKSLWPLLWPWWRECVSRPHDCWEYSSTSRCSASAGADEFVFFEAANSDENYREMWRKTAHSETHICTSWPANCERSDVIKMESD